MDAKLSSYSENIAGGSPENTTQKNTPIIHRGPVYAPCHIKPDARSPGSHAIQGLNTFGSCSSEGAFEGQNSNLTKTRMDIHYRAHEARYAPKAVDFFSRKRMKTAGLRASAGGVSLENQATSAVNQGEGTVGSSTYLSGYSDLRRTTVEGQKNQPHSAIALADLGPTNNEGRVPCVGPCNSTISRPPVIEPVVTVMSESRENAETHQDIHVANGRCNQPRRSKKSGSRHEVPDTRAQPRHSNADLCAVGEPSALSFSHNAYPACQRLPGGHSHDVVVTVGQGSASHAHQASLLSDGIEPVQSQHRKRRQPRNRAPGRRVRRCISYDDLHAHSPDGVNGVGEGSASYADEGASPACERLRDGDSHDAVVTVGQGSASQAHQASPLSHDAQPAERQRRKRRQPRNSTPGRRVRRHVSSDEAVGEASTSYAPQDASPTYEDLGDCIERCAYCDAAFWKEERLKGHTSSGGVPQYHLCCGGGKVYMQPDPDPPELWSQDAQETRIKYHQDSSTRIKVMAKESRIQIWSLALRSPLMRQSQTLLIGLTYDNFIQARLSESSKIRGHKDSHRLQCFVEHRVLIEEMRISRSLSGLNPKWFYEGVGLARTLVTRVGDLVDLLEATLFSQLVEMGVLMDTVRPMEDNLLLKKSLMISPLVLMEGKFWWSKFQSKLYVTRKMIAAVFPNEGTIIVYKVRRSSDVEAIHESFLMCEEGCSKAIEGNGKEYPIRGTKLAVVVLK
ncbi:hypothetical protein CTI12_AA422310 [Artemisia annua]|uniref:Uncharacterized protein n=1 Tax=Artemisia annua TaxID=35608 RepID=A0A2U1M4A2_ARTAN|nr:hypothetical protein CTI12_AA422310 [Artemisia annua]